MHAFRHRIAIGFESRLAEVPKGARNPFGHFRGPQSQNLVHRGQSEAFSQCARPFKRRAQNGVNAVQRRWESRWQAPRTPWGTPKRSNAGGALAIVFGVGAVAMLAAPAASWAQDLTQQEGDSTIKTIDTKQEYAAEEEEKEEATTDVSAGRKIRISELPQHDKDADTQWVVRGTSVYDITDFIESHPGGEVILRACGGSIDPYWKLFTIHNNPDVLKILSEYYIGEVDGQDLTSDGQIDWSALPGAKGGIDDPFKDDPERDASLVVHTAKPCNAETPPSLLEDFLTPLKIFFVRNHLWVPQIKPEEHKLTIELSNGDEIAYTLDDLKQKFKKHTVTVTLQCAGNRRSHMSQAPPGKTAGLQWNVGAIGNAEFSGVRLRDVLRDSGYDVDEACSKCPSDPDCDDKHVHFTAPGDTYAASVPLQTALNPASDVLLAWEMNGEPMPRDHGGPLRAIVPGVVAARSVKWVGRVSIAYDEAQSQWQKRDYKCFGPNVRAEHVTGDDWDAAQSIQEMPVQSAITHIRRAEESNAENVTVQGFAFSGGGRGIVRVDVSADGGKTWKQACLRKDAPKGSRRWSWTLWSIEWPKDQMPQGADQKAEFVVKAVDESYNSQPNTFDSTWNFRGLCGSAWHRVSVEA